MLLLLAVLGFGFSLIVGQHFVPNFVMLWFASPQGYVMQWREAIVVVVASLAVLYAYGSYRLVRALAVPLALVGCLGGAMFFWDHSSYIFDSLFIVSAGVWASLIALQAGARLELENGSAWQLEPAQAWRRTRRLQRARGLSALLYRNNIRDDSHLLVLQ